MTCGVCLEDDVEVINIFNEEGIRLKISTIIAQHFWFQPSVGDSILSKICSSCWDQIANFHIFYTTVKEAHKKFQHRNEKINDEEQIYTIEDSDDEEISAEGTDGRNKVGGKTIPNNENAYLLPSFNSLPEEARVFFRHEHEALLDKYTYVEATTEQILNESENSFDEFSIKSQYDENYGKVVSSKGGNTFTNDQQNLFGIELQSKMKQCEEHEKIELEDKLIANYISLECEQCYVKMKTFIELFKHYQSTHGICGYVRCCGKKLPRRSYVLDHINQHINPESYKCKQCNKSFSNQYAIKNHRAMKHAPESSKIHKCKECLKRFTNDYSLNKHMLSHKNEHERRLYCTECGKTFCSSKALEGHRDSHHKRLNGHICHVCGTLIKGKRFFAKHIRDHAATLGSDAVKDPVCPICGKLSASIKTLRHHIRYVHSALRPHKCSVCGKGFKIRQKLKEHMGTHAVGVSLKCPYCPKQFRSKTHVYSHKYRMHKKEYEMERQSRVEGAINETYSGFESSCNNDNNMFQNSPEKFTNYDEKISYEIT